MLIELLVRFALGGVLVALFSIAGNAFEPRTFSGIFGAAPSVALATLALTHAKHGPAYVATMRRGLTDWLDWRHMSLDEMRGKLSLQSNANPGAFERAQYIRALHSWTP